MLQSKSKIYKYFKAFADAHQTIERIGFEFEEQLENFAGEEKEYPILFVSPLDSPTLENRGLREMGFRIYCLDIIQVSDRSNVSNIINKTDLILYDFIQFFHQDGDSEIYIQGQPIVIPTNNHLTDYCSGHYIDLLIQSKTGNSCGAPMVGYTPPPSGECADGTVNVQKSDGVLISAVTAPSGGTETYNVADSVITVNSATFASVKATDGLNIPVVDSNGDAVATTVVGGEVQVDDLPCAISGTGETLMKTGQTTSYRTGDDGDIQAGREVDFFILPDNNPFGNTQRFTGITGGYYDEALSGYYDKDGVATTEALAFPDDIFIDWSQYNGTTCLGYRRGLVNVDINWLDAIDDALALSIGGYTTGWRLPNLREMLILCTFDRDNIMEYIAINIGGVGYTYWTSTSNPDNTNNAYQVGNGGNTPIFNNNKISTTSSRRYVPCRLFTVTGTTLT